MVAASVDTLENALKMQQQSGARFPIAYGITQADANTLGSWWSEQRNGFIQPTEFVLGSLYASGPIGRMSVDEVLYMIRARERR